MTSDAMGVQRIEFLNSGLCNQLDELESKGRPYQKGDSWHRNSLCIDKIMRVQSLCSFV